MNDLISDSSEIMHGYSPIQYWYKLGNIQIDLREIKSIVKSEASRGQNTDHLLPTVYSIVVGSRTLVLEEGAEGLEELLDYINAKTLSPQDLAKRTEALTKPPTVSPELRSLLNCSDFVGNQLVSDDGLHLKTQNSNTSVPVSGEDEGQRI